jgi:hypothetical protein
MADLTPLEAFMRFSTSTTAAACVLAAGLAAAGCAGASGPAGDTATATPEASAGAGTAPAATAPAQPAGSADRCQPQNLSFSLGTAASGVLPVEMTNAGSAACVMDGFAGVDLVGLARGQADYTWSLDRQSAGYSPVTLQPGGTAHFNLMFLVHTPDDGGDDIQVGKMVITPPDDFTQARVAWVKDLELQDAATHPVTYIGPVVPGA